MTLHAPSRPPRFGTARATRLRTLLRGCAAALLVCGLLLGGAAVQAQGRGGGGPGGGPGGGGMGGGGGRAEFVDRGAAPAMGRAPVRSGAQLGLTGRWWDDGSTAKRVGLRTDQQRRMDDIFETNKGTLVSLLGNLEREEGHLASLSPKELQDETKVFTAIDHVARARADLEKAKAHVMMQIRQQMDTSQLAALDREIASAK